MSKENLPSEEALFKLLALPPSRANDNSAANANVSRLEIKYPLPTEPQQTNGIFIKQLGQFGSFGKFDSDEKVLGQPHKRANLLLLMYLSPKYSRLIREEDAQQIYNFNQRSDDVFMRCSAFGALGISALFVWRPGFTRSIRRQHIIDHLQYVMPAFIIGSLGSGVLGTILWRKYHWNVILSSIKPYDMDEPERAAAYKSAYMNTVHIYKLTAKSQEIKGFDSGSTKESPK